MMTEHMNGAHHPAVAMPAEAVLTVASETQGRHVCDCSNAHSLWATQKAALSGADVGAWWASEQAADAISACNALEDTQFHSVTITGTSDC